MFKLVSRPQFTREVTVSTPVDGGYENETFKARFNLLDVDEFNTHDLNTATGTRNLLIAIIAHLDDVTDEKENVLPYNDALRDAVIKKPTARMALVNEYLTAVAEAAKGN